MCLRNGGVKFKQKLSPFVIDFQTSFTTVKRCKYNMYNTIKILLHLALIYIIFNLFAQHTTHLNGTQVRNMT